MLSLNCLVDCKAIKAVKSTSFKLARQKQIKTHSKDEIQSTESNEVTSISLKVYHMHFNKAIFLFSKCHQNIKKKSLRQILRELHENR